MADVFISYAREDRDRAAALAHEIAKRGWTVWWDRKILHGTQYRKVIGRELDAARCVIVLWSAPAIDSDWVLDEAGEGARRSILVPVQLENVTLPFGFRGIQTADLTRWSPGEPSLDLDELLASVGAMLGGEPAVPPPLPPKAEVAVWSTPTPRRLLAVAATTVAALAILFLQILASDKIDEPIDDSVTTSSVAETSPPVADTATTVTAPLLSPSRGVTGPIVYGAPFLTADRTVNAVLEIDVVEGLARPPLEVQTSRGTVRLVDVLADNGINATVHWGAIPASYAGADWNGSELRDAMREYREAEQPGVWHFYVIMAPVSDVNGIYSIMFDTDARRGAAVFVEGRQDPRSIMLDMLHELGHEMNLPHPFDAYGDTRSVMSYPHHWKDWSYDDPRVYQYDSIARTHISRGPNQYVRPGGSKFYDYGAQQSWKIPAYPN
ncbi:MAG TPA: TIR domain-containing protein [Thermoanaerobaculia bacterium]|nr:TIR domain-containing protein [Thermoanaerobaculia bacterium]